MRLIEYGLEDANSSGSETLLLYRENRYNDKEVADYLNKAWQALTDMGFDMIFGAFRGIHYYQKNDEVCVTFQKQLGLGDQVMMVAFKKGDWRIDFAYETLMDIEKEKSSKQ